MRPLDETTPRILSSHLGYAVGAANAVIAVVPEQPLSAELLHLSPGAAAGTRVTELSPGPVERVAGWSGGPYSRIPLPAGLGAGTYVVRVRSGGLTVDSEAFVVSAERLQRQTMSDVLAYFKAMRSSGEIDRKDRAAHFWDDPDGPTVDARGGWLDASGDTSKFLSHLTYTSMMSPQQIPLCAWAMLAARDELAGQNLALSTRLRDEALWGADFLYRFRSAEGYFYTGIFDALTKKLEERVITAPLQNSVRTTRYQAAYRHGAGLAIAALARASTVDSDGDYSRTDYLIAAREAFIHLEQHNRDYLFDGKESIIDDYTALLAATELAEAGEDFVQAARRRARSLIDRYQHVDGPGWFRGDDEGRPYFHAAEPGLPILALLRFAEVLPEVEEAAAAREIAVRAMTDVLDRTAAVANPFGYPRSLAQPLGEAPREGFFFPHANETGYWWQGENAAIASLSAAASACARIAAEDAERLRTFANDQLAWIVGRNPFDSSMLQGRGRNNADYSSDFPNLPGGIVNGITSGWSDENDIAFLPDDAPEGDSWRWAEQWIPHTGWFLLAVASAH